MTDPYSYDLVPYTSYPFSNTSPENLYTIARLFKISAMDFRHCRVLELGCASGGNIIPHAQNHPECEVIGIDLSAREIESGRQFVEKLELKNIQLLSRSIMDIDQGMGRFDYIICHGVYSWVPDNVRQKILSICKENLNRNGIAFVSYNTLPGWNMVKTIRDMMLFHTREISKPENKIKQARQMLKFINKSLKGENSTYARFLQTQMETLDHARDDYLFHEYLEDENNPIYFSHFIESVKESGLQYLVDTNLKSVLLDDLPRDTVTQLNMAGDMVKIEQYLDFIHNRRFRCSLLVQKWLDIDRNITDDIVEDFCFCIPGLGKKVVGGADLKEGVEVEFTNGKSNFSVSNRYFKLALVEMANRKNKPVSLLELSAMVAKKLDPDEDIDLVYDNLKNNFGITHLAFSGVVSLYSSPGKFITEITEKPRVTAMARLQAVGGNFVTNQLHQHVNLSGIQIMMIRNLDGTKDLAALAEDIYKDVENGKIELKDSAGDLIKGEEAATRVLKLQCENMLETFSRHALLVG